MNCSQTQAHKVVIVGNGPSGVTLSYILSGNLPYFSGKVPHHFMESEGTSVFDKCKSSPELSIVEQDLQYLSEGLQGRSQNPVALLFDHLNQPNADVGLYEESTLTWHHHGDRKVTHVVLGRDRNGGSWHQMQGAQLTVSLNNWLDLPGWSFREWLKQHRQQLEDTASSCSLVKNDVYGEGNPYDRVSTAHVAEYYENYVTRMGLEKNFDAHVNVISVKRKDNLWEVRGVKKTKNKSTLFRVYAESVVLATGLTKPKRLGIDGESLPFVHHHLRKVVDFSTWGGRCEGRPDGPVLVVGDGLSAADVVLELFSKEIPVVHVLRHDLNDEELILNKLPTQVYHDYAKVKTMMCTPFRDQNGACLYEAHFKSQLLSISKQRECKIKTADGNHKSLKVSAVFILIGAKPDLSFLKEVPPLGVDPSKDVDCRHNPIDIDPYTHECRRVKNLFAMGPLVGDNFVRFGVGGALAIASCLHKNGKG